MTLAIAWGTPYFEGGTPGRAPFTPGAQGTSPYVDFSALTFTLGLTEAPGYGGLSVTHTYAPTDGAPEYAVGTYVLNSFLGPTKNITVGPSEQDGLHTFTASDGYSALPIKLVLSVAPASPPYQSSPGYGAVAWYEEAAEPPVSVFWTRFINSKEVIE